MDRAVVNSLNFKQIMDLIQPAGDYGNHARHHLKGFKPGQEKELQKEYKRLSALISVLDGNRQLSEKLSAALTQTPYLNHTLKELPNRALYLHECFEIKKLVHYSLQLKETCSDAGLSREYPFPELVKLYTLLDPDKTKSPFFSLSSAFDPKLAQCISEINVLQQAKRKAEHQLLQQVRKKLGLPGLGIRVVISRQQADQVKVFSKSKFYYLVEENYANLTYHLQDNDTMADLKMQIVSRKQQLSKLEEKVLHSLSVKIRSYHKELVKTAEVVQMLDWDFAKALFALRYNCCIPQITDKVRISLKQAVNIPVKLSLTEPKRRFQATDMEFDRTINVMTGPNMGGKTTALKSIGQICLLAHYGIPVPAKEAELCLFDFIWYNQETEGGENLSSFGREIVSLVHVMKRKGRTLYLLDELAKGTNPLEGEAILTSVLQYLSEKPCLVLAATHYDKPAQLDIAVQYAIQGINLETLEEMSFTDNIDLRSQLELLNQLMDYAPVRLGSKDTPPQNALPIAQILGLPDKIVKMARRLMQQK